MDKIFPYVIDETLMQKIQRGIIPTTVLLDDEGAQKTINSFNNSENDKYLLKYFQKCKL